MENKMELSEKNVHGFEILGFSALHGTEKTFAAIRFSIPNFRAEQTSIIPMDSIRSAELKKYLPQKFAMPEKSTAQILEAIRKEISLKLSVSSSSDLKILLQQGFSKVQQKWVYTVGDMIINDTDKAFLPYNPNKTEFLSGGRMPEAVTWIKIFCAQGNAQSALLLCAVTPFLRPVTESVGLPVRIANAYVVGPSGSGKTSYAELLTSVFGQHGFNLGSKKSQIAAEHTNYIDKPMLIDDLNKSASSREYERKLALLSELLQMTSCAGDILSDEGRMDLSGTALIVTAEARIPNASSINRCIVIKLDTPFNSKALTYLQSNRHLYTFFIKKFIDWLCKNASAMTEYVKKNIISGGLDIGIAHEEKKSYIGFARISNSVTAMKTAQYLLVKFLSACASDNICREIDGFFERGIKASALDTLDSVKNKEPDSEIEEIVTEIFRSDKDDIVAKNYDEYRDDKTALFFRYKDGYYFRAENLSRYIYEVFGKTYSTKAILNGLDPLLVFNNEGRSHHLPRPLRKHEKNKRFSALSVSALTDRILQKSSSYWDYCSSPIKELRKNKF